MPSTGMITIDKGFLVPRTASSELEKTTSLPKMDKSRLALPKKTTKAPSATLGTQDKIVFRYNRYLQNEFFKVLMATKAEEKSKETAAEITKVCKTFDFVSNELMQTTKQVQDVKNMETMQNQIDSQLIELNNFQKKYEPVTPCLEAMKHTLDPLDKLKCQNVKLPESPEEWEKLESVASQVKHQLAKMHGKFEAHSQQVENAGACLKNFQAKRQQVQQDLEILEKDVEKATQLSLKNAAGYLENDVDLP